MKKDLRFVRTAIIALIAFAMFACTYASADSISGAFPGIYGGGESADVLADIGNNDMLPENTDCIKVYSISPSEFSDLASGRAQNANMTGNDKNVRWYFISENGSIAKAQKTEREVDDHRALRAFRRCCEKQHSHHVRN